MYNIQENNRTCLVFTCTIYKRTTECVLCSHVQHTREQQNVSRVHMYNIEEKHENVATVPTYKTDKSIQILPTQTSAFELEKIFVSN